MPISEKIKNQIANLDVNADFKELMLNILSEEDKGNHRFKETYEKMVNAYLSKKDGNEQ